MEGKIIKEARERVGLTQAQLAAKLGYKSAQFISNAERSICELPKAQFKKLAKAIGPTAVRKMIALRARNYLKELRSALH